MQDKLPAIEDLLLPPREEGGVFEGEGVRDRNEGRRKEESERKVMEKRGKGEKNGEILFEEFKIHENGNYHFE